MLGNGGTGRTSFSLYDHTDLAIYICRGPRPDRLQHSQGASPPWRPAAGACQWRPAVARPWQADPRELPGREAPPSGAARGAALELARARRLPRGDLLAGSPPPRRPFALLPRGAPRARALDVAAALASPPAAPPTTARARRRARTRCPACRAARRQSGAADACLRPCSPAKPGVARALGRAARRRRRRRRRRAASTRCGHG